MKVLFQYSFLYSDIWTADDIVAHHPWNCETELAEWFNFPKDTDSYPKNGFLALKRNCQDLKDIVADDAKWKALREFFDYTQSLTDKKDFDAICSSRADNAYAAGAKVYKEYFDFIWKRAGKREEINKVMRRLNVLPFQAYDACGYAWPPPPMVSCSI